MNLVDAAWIPVIGTDGRHRLVSLDTVFRDGDAIADLAANPCQRIALMRLLICIAQAALDGPVDEDDWRDCRARLGPAALAYLSKWHDRFKLFGEHAFLQVDGLVANDNALADKLDFELAAGNNPTLYDHAATPNGRLMESARLALNILVYQNFSPSGRIGVSEWEGRTTERSSEHAPCLEESMLHTILRGHTLLDTVRWNLLSREHVTCHLGVEWGKPCWEAEYLSMQHLQALVGAYLGRLVPTPRCLLCIDDSVAMTLADGIRYPKLPEYREPAATVRQIKRGTAEVLAYLSVDPEKNPWRELGSILSLQGSDKRGGASVLGHLRELDLATFDIWTGGLVADQGKLVDMCEWNLTLPVTLLDSLVLATYRKGVSWAESGRFVLDHSVKTYSEALNCKAKRTRAAQRLFWTHLDVNNDELAGCAADGGTQLKERWEPTIKTAMRDAYARTCPHETPRQIEAYAQGWKLVDAWRAPENGG